MRFGAIADPRIPTVSVNAADPSSVPVIRTPIWLAEKPMSDR